MYTYLTKPVAKKITLSGLALCMLSYIISLSTLFSVYGKARGCIETSADCKLTTEQIAGKISVITGYAGMAILLTGLALYVIVTNKKKEH